MIGPQPGTPTPWVAHRYLGIEDSWFIRGGLPNSICGRGSRPLTEQDAAAIVHRINNWDAVVEALAGCLDALEKLDAGETKRAKAAHAALKLARGEA